MRLYLKVAILKSGKSQRQISLDARIPEGRLSDLVRGRVSPSSSDRAALQGVLGGDYFDAETDMDLLLQPAMQTSARG